MNEKLRIYQNILIFLSTGEFKMNAQTAQELGKALQQISGDIENMKKIDDIAKEEAKEKNAEAPLQAVPKTYEESGQGA